MSILASNCVICYIVIVIYLITQDIDLINYIFYLIHIPLQFSQFFDKIVLGSWDMLLPGFYIYSTKKKWEKYLTLLFCISFLYLQLQQYNLWDPEIKFLENIIWGVKKIWAGMLNK